MLAALGVYTHLALTETPLKNIFHFKNNIQVYCIFLQSKCINIQSVTANNKRERLLTLRQIVANKDVHQQDVLLSELRNEGFSVTQATLSRDLKELGISKVPDGEGGYRYTQHNDKSISTKSDKVLSGIVSIEVSGQMAVVKTLPGYASVAGTLVDSRRLPQVMGSIAGDDTLLVVLRQGTDVTQAQNDLKQLFF